MGRRNTKYFKDMHQQAYEKLVSMQAFGESKHAAMKDGTIDDKIFSFSTYKIYWRHTKDFIAYMKKNHPEVTTLKNARKFTNEWLQDKVERRQSAWTVHAAAKAVGKLYGIKPGDKDYFTPPERNRVEIKRSRGDAERDKHFSKKNNDELIKFCQGTGLRRGELELLTGADLITKEEIEKEIAALEKSKDQPQRLAILKDTRYFKETYFFEIGKGKGGRSRISPIIGKNSNQIITRAKETAQDEKIWQHINKNADIHSYRAEYATKIYKQTARKIEEIPFDKINKGSGKAYQSDVYVCRKDELGRKLDKKAMLICSKALGHNRISVVAESYLRGL